MLVLYCLEGLARTNAVLRRTGPLLGRQGMGGELQASEGGWSRQKRVDASNPR
jgi:hypothetical protein